jgi:hypothetical protein
MTTVPIASQSSPQRKAPSGPIRLGKSTQGKPALYPDLLDLLDFLDRSFDLNESFGQRRTEHY